MKLCPNTLGADEKMTYRLADVGVSRLDLADMGLGVFDTSGGLGPGVSHHTVYVEGLRDSVELVRELKSRSIKVDGVRVHSGDNSYSVCVNHHPGNRLELSASFN